MSKNMNPKPFCVGDVTTNTIVSRHDTAEGAARATVGNPRDLLAFHESHASSLGMAGADDDRHLPPREQKTTAHGRSMAAARRG